MVRVRGICLFMHGSMCLVRLRLCFHVKNVRSGGGCSFESKKKTPRKRRLVSI